MWRAELGGILPRSNDYTRAVSSCLANSKHFHRSASPTLSPPGHFRNPTPNSISCPSYTAGRRLSCWATLSMDHGKESLVVAMLLCSALALSFMPCPRRWESSWGQMVLGQLVEELFCNKKAGYLLTYFNSFHACHFLLSPPKFCANWITGIWPHVWDFWIASNLTGSAMVQIKWCLSW